VRARVLSHEPGSRESLVLIAVLCTGARSPRGLAVQASSATQRLAALRPGRWWLDRAGEAGAWALPRERCTAGESSSLMVGEGRADLLREPCSRDGRVPTVRTPSVRQGLWRFSARGRGGRDEPPAPYHRLGAAWPNSPLGWGRKYLADAVYAVAHPP
jgi:hypothetical protein